MPTRVALGNPARAPRDKPRSPNHSACNLANSRVPSLGSKIALLAEVHHECELEPRRIGRLLLPTARAIEMPKNEKIPGDFWAIVVATDDGEHRAGLPSLEVGEGAPPKAFRRFGGEDSLLALALRRAFLLAGAARTMVVVSRDQEAWWKPELSQVQRGNILVEPRDRGTAPRVLRAMLEVLREEPGATVVVLPADHHVKDEQVLAQAVQEAAAATWDTDNRVALLGILPHSDDTDLDFIVPSAEPSGHVARRVASYVERPSAAWLPRLRHAGALWSSSILVSRLSALVRLYDRAQPALLGAFLKVFASGADCDPAVMDRLYASLETSHVSRDLLARMPELLRVVPLPPCGWSDLRVVDRSERRARWLTQGGTAATEAAAPYVQHQASLAPRRLVMS